jgi:voltage-gated potassium channel
VPSESAPITAPRTPSARTGPAWAAPTTGLAIATAAIGVYLLAAGFASAYLAAQEFYSSAFAGVDPPFLVIAGLALLGVTNGIRRRSRVAWLFAIVAPAITIAIAAFTPNLFSVSAALVSSVLVVLLYLSRARFYREEHSATETAQYAVLVSALLSLLFGVAGARLLGGHFVPSIQSWSEAVYFTIATISTNGSQYVPLDPEARTFTVLLIVFGVSSFLSAIVVFFVPFLQNRIERVASRLEQSEVGQLAHHVLVCGTSGSIPALAEVFRSSGVPVVFLAPETDQLRQLSRDGFRTHTGDPSSEQDLKDVGVERASALVAASETDAENLIVVLTARSLLPNLRIIALAMTQQSVAKLRRAGANEVVSIMTVAAQLVAEVATRPN